MPTKSTGEAIVFSSSSVNFGVSPPASARYPVGVRPLEHHGHEAGVPFAGGGLRGPDVLGRVDDRDGDADVLGEADLRIGRSVGADRLDGQAVAEHRVVPDLLQLGVREAQPGAPPRCTVFPPTSMSIPW